MNTTARMVMEYQGKKFWFEYDFRCEYPKNCAEYMFFDGNYSCDCNKSLFLDRAGYPGFKEEFDCGEGIKIVEFAVFNPGEDD